MRGYAIAPDYGVMLAQIVADERPELVVETGSGVSTLIIAYALEKLGRGRVVALEHDPEYARRTRDELRRHGLEAYATVIDAPLEPIRLAGQTYRWYAQRALDDLGEIDLVVDDGPPRHVGDMLRYASLHVLAKRMSRRGLFVLDVVGDEERAILERWRTELPELSQERLATKKGNVLIRRAA
jgi:predicted O-methyltransferase YrrM